MALTFVNKMRTIDGGKKHVLFQVTHDEAITTITAADLGMNYIDYAIVVPVSLTTTVDGAKMHMLSDGGPGVDITIANALSAGELMALEAWGW